nr:taste receptor type 2 member 40-like [Pelodiscus sinensis]|eukprot:XP_006131036.3 taste receptor type 2 member 40-like [Pelodiscus sinensis]
MVNTIQLTIAKLINNILINTYKPSDNYDTQTKNNGYHAPDSYILCDSFDPDIFYAFQTPNLFLVVWIFMNQVSLCFASCLSVFYCVKIATFNLSVFNWLKPKLSKLVPWLLLGSLLHSLITTVVFTFVSYFFEITSRNFTDHPSRNITITDKRKNLAKIVFLIHSIGSGFPLSLFIASSGLLILSLWKHIRKMNLNSDFNPSFRNPSTEAHLRAIKSVLSFLFLYIMYFAVSTVTIGILSHFTDEWKIIMFSFGVAAYPFVHSTILILGNPKLKQASAKILHSANCCFR